MYNNLVNKPIHMVTFGMSYLLMKKMLLYFFKQKSKHCLDEKSVFVLKKEAKKHKYKAIPNTLLVTIDGRWLEKGCFS